MDYKELIERLRDNQKFSYRAIEGLCVDAANSIETLLAEREAAGWISVEDGLPDFGKRVLVACDSFIGEAWLCSSKRWFQHVSPMPLGCFEQPTHWMPLPTLPDRERTER